MPLHIIDLNPVYVPALSITYRFSCPRGKPAEVIAATETNLRELDEFCTSDCACSPYQQTASKRWGHFNRRCLYWGISYRFSKMQRVSVGEFLIERLIQHADADEYEGVLRLRHTDDDADHLEKVLCALAGLKPGESPRKGFLFSRQKQEMMQKIAALVRKRSS